ncbi:uncharacterized protein BDW47DRAFT_109769 [Aspergillus candidus]|uniref:2Fe-2S ferredoxin-type domain-containing protein n=1 Tax=Aspergillus candidus TaxID=41067 RepID=A0A2I2F571_ASPCN|nr:hypothetical protein BDW47DRAFT_109769 [Aspergillus candidus]PLB35767.1 hypothetical protein BDW47DRAFT_109769 [Aspergillus candidus]
MVSPIPLLRGFQRHLMLGNASCSRGVCGVCMASVTHVRIGTPTTSQRHPHLSRKTGRKAGLFYQSWQFRPVLFMLNGC